MKTPFEIGSYIDKELDSRVIFLALEIRPQVMQFWVTFRPKNYNCWSRNGIKSFNQLEAFCSSVDMYKFSYDCVGLATQDPEVISEHAVSILFKYSVGYPLKARCFIIYRVSQEVVIYWSWEVEDLKGYLNHPHVCSAIFRIFGVMTFFLIFRLSLSTMRFLFMVTWIIAVDAWFWIKSHKNNYRLAFKNFFHVILFF